MLNFTHPPVKKQIFEFSEKLQQSVVTFDLLNAFSTLFNKWISEAPKCSNSYKPDSVTWNNHTTFCISFRKIQIVYLKFI